jgi:hypothetical protein
MYRSAEVIAKCVGPILLVPTPRMKNAKRLMKGEVLKVAELLGLLFPPSTVQEQQEEWEEDR